MINPAPGFGPIFGPLGPTAGTGSLGTGSGLRASAACAENQPRRPILRPVRGYFVLLVPPQKGKMLNLRPPKGIPACHF